MEQYAIVAEPRTELGKGANRRLRRGGKIPGVIYGAGKDAVPITLDARTLNKQLENEAFFSHILTVEVQGGAGEKSQAVLKALQRAPSTAAVTHLDFLRVSSEVEITMNVPLHFLNEDTAPGRKAGGVINHLQTEVEISCLPKDLPEYIAVDIGTMEMGDSKHLSELVLPDGVRLLALGQEQENDQPVVSIAAPQMLDVEPEEEGAEDEVADAAEDDTPDEG